jgi:hypothetical protein
MIYDVATYFSGDNISYHPQKTDVNVPTKGIESFYKNKIKIESSKLQDIETAFGQYEKIKDDVLSIDVQNEDQYKRLKSIRNRYGIDDNMFNMTMEDLSNGAKLTQFQGKIKRFANDYEFKSLIEEQKKADKFLQDINVISSMNEPLAILAKKDFLEKYANKSERTFGGFELNINDYTPIDVDVEMEKMAKDIEREYRMEKDPNSPTGDGYIFINKISGVTENGRDVFERRIDQMGASKGFQNNVKSYIALNSPDADYNDPDTYNDFVTAMMEDHLGDKVVAVESNKLDDELLKAPDGTSSATAKKMPSTLEERKVFEVRQLIERDPAFANYDLSSLGVYWGSSMRLSGAPYVDDKEREVIGPDGKRSKVPPTGDLVIPVMSGTDNASEIRIKKMVTGQKRMTVDEEYGIVQNQQAQEQSAQAPKTGTPKADPGDLTINNPERSSMVQGAGITGVNKGGYTQDNKWVYVGASGKVVVIDDPVNLAQNGFSLKSNSKAGGKQGYHLNRSTADKAKAYHDTLGYEYEITEAGTDTLPDEFKGGHQNPAHYNGTGYDFALREEDSDDPTKIFNAILTGSSKDLDVQFETADQALFDKVLKKVASHNAANPNNKIKNPLFSRRITGNHFSVYDRTPAINAIKPGDVDAVDYAGKGNVEYNSFVESNSLRNLSQEEVTKKNVQYLSSGNRKPIFYYLVQDLEGVPLMSSPGVIDWTEGKVMTDYGAIEDVVTVFAQSKNMEDYFIQNPNEIKDFAKFIRNPLAQEQYMDFLISDYNDDIQASKKPNIKKFDQDELFYIRHHDGNLGYVDKGRTGDELISQFGTNITEAKKSLNATEFSIYKLAYYKAIGDINDNMSLKNKIAYIEANPSTYKNQYLAANPTSTAIGKYQIMWSLHKNKIKAYLPEGDISSAPASASSGAAQTTQSSGIVKDSVPDPMAIIK